jgi:D-alanyl-D-alanine carboxypeptidase (penicillin-binding protein 5/6)
VSTALQQGNITLDDKVRISKKAWKMGGSKMFVKVNDEVPVSELIKGVIVDSGNDASVALAEYVAGGEDAFTGLMNSQAEALGMTNSHFTDATGLPHPNHYSTARDLGTLARAITQDFPEEYSWYSQKWFTYAGIKQSNRNRLLWRYQYADGLKTGHTDDAGYCLVASANKDGMRLISVVLGAPSDSARTEDSERLLTYGFRFYKTVKLFEADTPIQQARIYYGEKSEIAVGVTNALAVTVPNGQQEKVLATIETMTDITAPINVHDPVGKITVNIDGKTIRTAPLVALESDTEGGWLTQSTDYVAQTWNSWFS